MAVWLTPGMVTAHGGQTTPGGGDYAALELDCDAVAGWVEDRRRDLPWDDYTSPEDVPATIRLGAAMLAWKYFQRRLTPTGVVGLPDLGIANVLGEDPDINRLLGIAAHRARVIFGAAARAAS